MKVLILGGDGYLGWPTAMAFSKKDHEVMVIDNYLRRDLTRKHDVEPLWPVPNLLERVRLRQELTGQAIQAIAGYPLTVYGKGGQTRGYINIRNTIACVELAMLNPSAEGELQIYNQVTETFSVNELAENIVRIGKKRGHVTEIKSIENPRVEKEEHYYNPTYSGLKDLGLSPHYLTDEVLNRMFEVVENFKNKIQEHKIFRGVKW